MRTPLVTLALLAVVAGTVAMAQSRRGGRRVPAPAGDEPVARGSVPRWPVDEAFRRDLFTFVRIKYRSTYERQSLAWYTDYPDADLNMAFRLQQLTALRVDPDPKLIEPGDPALLDYPWAFMSGVGNIELDDAEAANLRRWLLNGGFLMVDDFWGEREWATFRVALRRVFPGPRQEPADLPRSHPIFHCLFDLPDGLSLQTPNVGFAVANRDSGITWERADGREVHYRGVFDDSGRLMVMICHNTDTGDGWEEEGTDPWFFRTFAENKCYPLGLNIIYYAMTR